MGQDKEQLKRAIREAFGTGNFPEGVSLLSGTTGYNEPGYIETVFARKNWQEVKPVTDSKSPMWWGDRFRDDIFSYFSDAAFAYYAPALMLYVLDDYEGADVCADRIVMRLRSAWEEFTAKQQEVVNAFFEYLWETYGDGEACMGILQRQGLSFDEAAERVREMEQARKKAKCIDKQ
jgi:hypothetical protein